MLALALVRPLNHVLHGAVKARVTVPCVLASKLLAWPAGPLLPAACFLLTQLWQRFGDDDSDVSSGPVRDMRGMQACNGLVCYSVAVLC